MTWYNIGANKMADNIVFVGAGGHAKSVRAALGVEPRRLISAGEDESFVAEYAGEEVVITVGYVGRGSAETSVRRKVIDFYEKAGVKFGRVIAPSSIVMASAEIGEGAVVLSRTVVNVDAKVGRHAVVNTGAVIEHDVELGENVNVAPGAIVLGGAKIGANVFIGAGAIIAQEVSVCANAVIGAGALVRSDIVESGVYVGNPVRRIR